MSDRSHNRLTRPETLTAVGIILIAAGFLVPTTDLRSISALLPAAMLIGLIVLALVLLVMDQRKAARAEAPVQMTQAPKRVAGAFLLILGYALACDFIGFYVSTAVTIPLVAFAFGYRNPLGLLVATGIVVGSIWLIFDFGMSQSFPAGRLWKD
ncbi:tripartite tricarboxylate transporter TctB family protein [Donghicola tyrosinivorans]|uniref:Tripartite tricarboxylate transporter TctB family protein n=1 Tax=Donghicola tyrosinivorans TaxID=1652492 RepID=A0A2T0WHA0_9RHOB|nr:tripartite tricarboxylate transporter TctB family protein [Donghicola tyrosinivorans]PRY86081.1 tripartite tricarboxylate transporter TctB family protein [Donghicola tyrosinivorans]